MLKIDKLITSGLRLNLLRYFLAENPKAKVSIRQLSRELNYSPSHVKRELEVLESAGILRSEQIGNQKVYYKTYSGPLENVFKSEPHILLDKIKDVTGIDVAYVYHMFSDEFKMVIIGRPDIYFLNRIVRNIENEGDFSVQFDVYNKEEVYKRILPKPLFFIVGDEK